MNIKVELYESAEIDGAGSITVKPAREPRLIPESILRR